MFSLQDKNLANKIIKHLQPNKKPYHFMHVCGTHQDTLMKHGLDDLLESCNIHIGQGPVCPVCVTTPYEIEEMLLLAHKGITVASFGDMIQVPGSTMSLQQMKTEGGHVHTVYGIEDAVALATKQPNQDVVFMSVGFETTAPTTAATLLSEPPENFSVLCCHRQIPPALEALVNMGDMNIDGFIDPGHVSTIIGAQPYEALSKKYHVPQVIAGFEPLDILMATWMLVQQCEHHEAKVENEYHRAVRYEGNKKAQAIIKKVFTTSDVKWRGFPIIPRSGMLLHKKYSDYDARIKYEDLLQPLQDKTFNEPQGCRCGEVLRGLISPQDCALFSHQCTPEHPVGPCMVSTEGSCQIAYRYRSN